MRRTHPSQTTNVEIQTISLIQRVFGEICISYENFARQGGNPVIVYVRKKDQSSARLTIEEAIYKDGFLFSIDNCQTRDMAGRRC